MSKEHIIDAYRSQLLIALVGRMDGPVELDLQYVDEFAMGQGVSVILKDLKPAPELGEGRYTGKFVLEVVAIEDEEDRPIYVSNDQIGQA